MPTETFEFFVEREIEQIWVWSNTVRLVVDSRQSEQLSAYVDIHSDSVLTYGAKRVTLDVRNDPDEAGAVLRLLNDRVVGAVAVGRASIVLRRWRRDHGTSRRAVRVVDGRS